MRVLKAIRRVSKTARKALEAAGRASEAAGGHFGAKNENKGGNLKVEWADFRFHYRPMGDSKGST